MSTASSKKFKPGRSGNPKGRPRGTVNRSTRLIQALDRDLSKLITATKKQALAGDMQAMKILLDRALPIRRATLEPIDLPALAKAQTLTEKADAIMEAIASGQLAPDTGSTMLASLDHLSQILETDSLIQRIEALEAATNAKAQRA